MGAWIEIIDDENQIPKDFVAPLVGAWIEIIISNSLYKQCIVAPLVGAWIEIKNFVIVM